MQRAGHAIDWPFADHQAELLQRAINAPVQAGTAAVATDEKVGLGQTLYRALMAGVSPMIPFVVVGGLLIAAADQPERPSGPPPEPARGEVDRGIREDQFFKIPTERDSESAARSIQRVASSLTGHGGKLLDFRKRSREI